jgi:hypothetical protein
MPLGWTEYQFQESKLPKLECEDCYVRIRPSSSKVAIRNGAEADTMAAHAAVKKDGSYFQAVFRRLLPLLSLTESRSREILAT